MECTSIFRCLQFLSANSRPWNKLWQCELSCISQVWMLMIPKSCRFKLHRYSINCHWKLSFILLGSAFCHSREMSISHISALCWVSGGLSGFRSTSHIHKRELNSYVSEQQAGTYHWHLCNFQHEISFFKASISSCLLKKEQANKQISSSCNPHNNQHFHRLGTYLSSAEGVD